MMIPQLVGGSIAAVIAWVLFVAGISFTWHFTKYLTEKLIAEAEKQRKARSKNGK